MFGRKKQTKIEDQLIAEINEILEDETIKNVEQAALIRVKTRLEKGEYMQRVLNDFLTEVRPLALKSQLSPNVGKFYSDIINSAYSQSGWSGLRFM